MNTQERIKELEAQLAEKEETIANLRLDAEWPIVKQLASKSERIEELTEEAAIIEKELRKAKGFGWVAVCGWYDAIGMRSSGKTYEDHIKQHNWNACYSYFAHGPIDSREERITNEKEVIEAANAKLTKALDDYNDLAGKHAESEEARKVMREALEEIMDLSSLSSERFEQERVKTALVHEMDNITVTAREALASEKGET